MTRPDLDAIRARNLVDWTGNGKEELSGDISALLAYIDELEEDRNDWREAQEATQVKSDFWRSKFRTTYTVGETEWAHRIAVAEQRFVDEYDARKAAEREIAELKARIAVLEWVRT